MNKTIISAIAGVMLSTTAMATPLDSFFFSNGYTKPDSIISIQTKVNSGEYYNYPYIVGGGVEKGLFKKYLKDGTALPQIKSVTALKAALDRKQVVLVASKGEVHACLPIFAEIAKQNGVSCTDLMGHLVTNQAENEDFFSNIDNVLDTVQSKIDEISAELNDEVSEELAQEIAQEVEREITVVTQEALEKLGFDSETAGEIADATNAAATESVAGIDDTTVAQGIADVVAGSDPTFSSLSIAEQVADGVNDHYGTERLHSRFSTRF